SASKRVYTLARFFTQNAVMADFFGTHEGQPLESRSAPMRIRSIADILGAGGDGSVHPPNHRIRNSARSRRWTRPFPHVLTSNPRNGRFEVSEFGPRSSVSIPPMASESEGAQHNGNQNRSLCSAVASLR